MESITRFLTTKLKLKVNQAKSAVARPRKRKFLGFSFTGGREPRRRIAPKVVLRFKERMRELTRRTRGVSMEQRAKELSAYLRGWRGYFGFCQTPSVLESLDQWLRRRLRSVLWKRGTVCRTPQTGRGQKLTIGLELGDRRSWYCVVDGAGEVILEQKLSTTPKAMSEVFGAMPGCRIALETGMRSPWVSRLLSELGHEVIVAHAGPTSIQEMEERPIIKWQHGLKRERSTCTEQRTAHRRVRMKG